MHAHGGVYAVCSPYRQVTRFKGYEAPKTPVSTGPSTQKGQCLHGEICIIYTPQICVLSLMALDDSKGASRSAQNWCVCAAPLQFSLTEDELRLLATGAVTEKQRGMKLSRN